MGSCLVPGRAANQTARMAAPPLMHKLDLRDRARQDETALVGWWSVGCPLAVRWWSVAVRRGLSCGSLASVRCLCSVWRLLFSVCAATEWCLCAERSP